MKTKQETIDFCKREILPNIDDLQLLKEKYGKVFLSMIEIIVIEMVLIIVLRWGLAVSEVVLIISFVFYFATFPYFFYQIRSSNKKINEAYREKIAKPLLEFAVPELRFYPEKGIKESFVKRSRLFEFTFFDSKSSENLCRGTINGRPLQIANINLVDRSRDDCNKYFEGLFSTTTMEKKVDGIICVIPEFTKKTLFIQMILV